MTMKKTTQVNHLSVVLLTGAAAGCLRMRTYTAGASTVK